MSDSEYFYCPHCGSRLKKTDSEWIQGLEGSLFISFGADRRDCPICRGSIQKTSIIDGKYDHKFKHRSNPIGTIAWITVVATISLLLYQTDISFLGSLAISLAVGSAVYILLRCIRAIIKRLRTSWKRFAEPDGQFSLDYPPGWLTREQIEAPVDRNASFVALSPRGDCLLEVFLLKQGSLKYYADLCAEGQKNIHPDSRVIASVDFPLEKVMNCLKITLVYTEPTIHRKVESSTTDYFLIDAGSGVISLIFKVLSSKYEAMKATFERVVKSVKLSNA